MNAARERLLAWDFQMRRESPEAALYAFFWMALVEETFRDQYPEKRWPPGGSGPPAERPLLPAAGSAEPLVGRRGDPGREGNPRPDPGPRVPQGLPGRGQEAGGEVRPWQWGKVHTAEFRNQTLGESGIKPIEADLQPRARSPCPGATRRSPLRAWDPKKPFEVKHIVLSAPDHRPGQPGRLPDRCTPPGRAVTRPTGTTTTSSSPGGTYATTPPCGTGPRSGRHRGRGCACSPAPRADPWQGGAFCGSMRLPEHERHPRNAGAGAAGQPTPSIPGPPARPAHGPDGPGPRGLLRDPAAHGRRVLGRPLPRLCAALPFLVRWVTHLAASGFLFLLGVGQGLGARSRRRQGWGWGRITWQFLLRGLLLIAVQLVLVNRAWELSPSGWVVKWYFGVLFALGGGLILTAPLSGLKPWMQWLLALAALLACAWFGPRPADWQHYLPVWERFALVPGGSQTLWVSFPVLSWLAPLAFGLAFAGWLQADVGRAMRRAWILGLVFLAAFAGLRLADGFFNIRPASYRDLDRLPQRGQVSAQHHLSPVDPGHRPAAALPVPRPAPGALRRDPAGVRPRGPVLLRGPPVPVHGHGPPGGQAGGLHRPDVRCFGSWAWRSCTCPACGTGGCASGSPPGRSCACCSCAAAAAGGYRWRRGLAGAARAAGGSRAIRSSPTRSRACFRAALIGSGLEPSAGSRR